MTLRYEPGNACTIARGRVVVLLPEGAGHDLMLSLWERTGEDVGIVEMLQALTGAFDSDLRTVPPFAIVEWHGARANAAVRGAMRVVAETATGERLEIDGRDVTTWSERGIEDVTQLVATIGEVPERGPLVDDGRVLPLSQGVVLASAITWSLDEGEADGKAGAHAAAAASKPATPSTAAPAPDEAVRPTRAELKKSTVPVPVASAESEVETAAVSAFRTPVEPWPQAVALPVVPVDGSTSESVDTPAVEHAVDETLVPQPELPVPAYEPETAPQPTAGEHFLSAATEHGDLVQEPVAAPETPVEDGEEDDYGHLWGSTVLRTVEDAAVRAAADGEDESADPSQSMSDAPEEDAARAVSVNADVEETPQDVTLAPIDTDDVDHDGYTLYSSALADLHASSESSTSAVGGGARVPSYAGAAEAFDESGSLNGPGQRATFFDHRFDAPAPAAAQGYAGPEADQAYGAPDGHGPGAPMAGAHGSAATQSYGAPAATLDRPESMATHGYESPFLPEGESPPEPAAPQLDILARACAQGHANSPSREICAVCGAPLIGDALPMSRPALGRVFVSTGQVVDLDRDVVVGRRPRSVRGETHLARLVTVPSPQQDISRSHLEITLEGWHVLLSDLNTTNGTTLLRPGQSPRRLHPGEPTLMADGDAIDMGDGVTLTFAGLQ